jgi:hypothetical protein
VGYSRSELRRVSAYSDRSDRVILQEKRGIPTKSTRDVDKKIGSNRAKNEVAALGLDPRTAGFHQQVI